MSTLGFKHIRNRSSPEQLTSNETATLINLYDACINYIDDNLGRLFDILERQQDNTIIVIIADHGDTFGEHGLLGHSIYEESIRVPLIIVGGGIKAGTVVQELVELMDLTPTIADLAGVSPAPSFHGKSLLPLISGSQNNAKGIIVTIISPWLQRRMLAYRTHEWKYIRSESLSQVNTVISEEVYNLKTDPKERYNLHASRDNKARTFELEAIDELQKFKQLKEVEETIYEKERIKARLKKPSKR